MKIRRHVMALLTFSWLMGATVGTTEHAVYAHRFMTVIAAGDIACSPRSEHFNNGAGDREHCQMKATSDLVLALRPDAVLVLGDAQYPHGGLEDFQESYALSWGRFKDITYPVPGNHEYETENAAGLVTPQARLNADTIALISVRGTSLH